MYLPESNDPEDVFWTQGQAGFRWRDFDLITSAIKPCCPGIFASCRTPQLPETALQRFDGTYLTLRLQMRREWLREARARTDRGNLRACSVWLGTSEWIVESLRIRWVYTRAT